MRITDETGRWYVSALAPAQIPAPETGTSNTASPGSNMGKRAVIKATATGTGAAVAAAPQRSPRIKTEVDIDEGEQERKMVTLNLLNISLNFFQHEL